VIQGRRVLGLITARGGSKGLPGKNILPLGGKPLIAWTIDAARSSRYIDRLVLSSDDPAIIQVAEAQGCEAPFQRPAELASDEATTMDVVFHALALLPDFDLVVLLQPTSPLRSSFDIDACLELLVHAPAAVSVRPAEDHPFLTFQFQNNGGLLPYAVPPAGQSLRRQDLPGAWCLNGAVYAADVGWLKEQRSFVSTQTSAHCMPAERSIDIDTLSDLHAAEQILRLSLTR
jgi:CMP-N,N'-diacetyllegionaminic acid synthase